LNVFEGKEDHPTVLRYKAKHAASLCRLPETLDEGFRTMSESVGIVLRTLGYRNTFELKPALNPGRVIVREWTTLRNQHNISEGLKVTRTAPR